GGNSVFLVVAELVGRIDRCKGPIVGDGKPDLHGRLGAGGRRARQNQQRNCDDRQRPRHVTLRQILHLILPMSGGTFAAQPPAIALQLFLEILSGKLRLRKPEGNVAITYCRWRNPAQTELRSHRPSSSPSLRAGCASWEASGNYPRRR